MRKKLGKVFPATFSVGIVFFFQGAMRERRVNFLHAMKNPHMGIRSF